MMTCYGTTLCHVEVNGVLRLSVPLKEHHPVARSVSSPWLAIAVAAVRC